MVLADTSVWVAHLRRGETGLERLLSDGEVLCHPFIIGELACGQLSNRTEILSLLQSLPLAAQLEHEEVMPFIEDHRLAGKGLGYIDIHLLASARLSQASLWTLDQPLKLSASRLSAGYADW
ncbi:MAG: type II toxin-antitoxin system VapC family toxin [Nitrospirota bacterium]